MAHVRIHKQNCRITGVHNAFGEQHRPHEALLSSTIVVCFFIWLFECLFFSSFAQFARSSHSKMLCLI